MAGEILTLGRSELARLLRAIVREGDPWQAAGTAGLPFPRVVEGVQQLLRHGLLAFDGQRLHLTDRGQALARELGVQAAPEIRCAACGGPGWTWASSRK